MLELLIPEKVTGVSLRTKLFAVDFGLRPRSPAGIPFGQFRRDLAANPRQHLAKNF